MGYYCKFIEHYYKDVEIDILVHNYNNIDIHSPDYPDITELDKRFGIKLEKTRLRKLDLNSPISLKEHFINKRIIEKITKEYDLFLNFMFLSKHVGKAKKNLYSCMFPSQKYQFNKFPQNIITWFLDMEFKRSYNYFITNSKFTNHWQRHFWKTDAQNVTVYPPVFWENELKEIDFDQKENMIISVGRFFVGAHNKKQDVLVDFFINNIEKFSGWKFCLVGALSNNPIDIEYVEKIRNKINDYPIELYINTDLNNVETLYSKAKIFWHGTGFREESDKFPEKMEHFGITTVEAMSNGVVPIVINKGGQTEIVNHSEDGYLWDSEEELLAYTMELISDSSRRIEMANKSVARAKDFSVEMFYEKNKEIFDAI